MLNREFKTSLKCQFQKSPTAYVTETLDYVCCVVRDYSVYWIRL
jgi:hypothetical protein